MFGGDAEHHTRNFGFRQVVGTTASATYADREDTVAAMGFVKQSLAVRSFLVVVGCLCEGDWEGESCFVFPPEGLPGRALRV